MDQLHKNRFQVAKHRPGLNIKAELLFKITAKGHLESKREKWEKVQSVLLLVGTQTCTRTHTVSLSFSLTTKVSSPFGPSRHEIPLEQPSSVTRTRSPRTQNRSWAKIEFSRLGRKGNHGTT